MVSLPNPGLELSNPLASASTVLRLKGVCHHTQIPKKVLNFFLDELFTYHIFITHSYVEGSLGLGCFLDVANRAAMNMTVSVE